MLLRLSAVLDILQRGPIALPELLKRLEHVYTTPESTRRMLRRDLEALNTLGLRIERSSTRPPIYTLFGTAPLFTEQELRALALIRDSFGERHPQATSIHALLARLTAQLNPEKQRIYSCRQTSNAPVQPAIDYTPYANRIMRLEQAISVGELLCLHYRNSHGTLTRHPRIEPHEIEFYERHFYLVAYSQPQRQSYDLRIDRIEQIESVMHLPPGSTHTPALISFRYRLSATLLQSGMSQRFIKQELVEELANGDVIIEAQGRNAFFIIQTLLRYRAHAELLEPAWLRERMIAEVQALARLYEQG